MEFAFVPSGLEKTGTFNTDPWTAWKRRHGRDVLVFRNDGIETHVSCAAFIQDFFRDHGPKMSESWPQGPDAWHHYVKGGPWTSETDMALFGTCQKAARSDEGIRVFNEGTANLDALLQPAFNKAVQNLLGFNT